jgi:hypothetical protein
MKPLNLMSGVGEMEWNLNDDKNFIMMGEHLGYVCVKTGLEVDWTL